MQVTVESTGALKRRMRVELPAESIEREVDSRLKSVGRTAKIKGFRPGKVPAKMVRQRYGKQVRDEVLSDLTLKSYTDAVLQENLNPAGGPQIEAEDGGEGFAYVATFEIMPEFELKGLDRIEVRKPVVDIAAADLDAMIDKLREQKAGWQAVERQSASGDKVVCDFSGVLDGELIEGGQGREVSITLGKGQMLPDFEKGLTGVVAGSVEKFTVGFPQDYHVENLAGKQADFEATIHSVEEMVLPDIDDELAAMFNVEQGGLERFRCDVRDNMEREAAQKVENDIRKQVMNGLLSANLIEIPQTLKYREMRQMQQEAMHRLGIEDHDQAPPLDNFAGEASQRVHLGLLLRKVIADGQITLDPTRVRAHVETLCAGYENAEDMVEHYLSDAKIMQEVEPLVLEQMAIDWLLDSANVEENKVGFTEYMNA